RSCNTFATGVAVVCEMGAAMGVGTLSPPQATATDAKNLASLGNLAGTGDQSSRATFRPLRPNLRQNETFLFVSRYEKRVVGTANASLCRGAGLLLAPQTGRQSFG